MEEPSVMVCSSMGYHSQTPPQHPTTTATTFENSCYRSLLDSHVLSDDDSVWGEDEWPQDRPLPLPEWGRERASLAFASLRDYMGFLSRVASHQRQTISIQPYDSVSNFIAFSEEYMASEFTNLQEFYRYYDPPLVSGRYSCVGLAADLASRLVYLEGHYPGFKDAIYQVSCEEELKDDYIGSMISSGQITTTTCIKEHMLLCVRVCIEGRAGVVLLDPGYHLPHPVTVMEDGLSPHSGPVNAATARSNVVRTYRYYFAPSSSSSSSSSSSFVIWEVEENRSGRIKLFKNIIHVSRPFLSGVNVTERRNLPYHFRILLGRDASGKFTTGLYFHIKPAPASTIVTFLHKVDGEMKHVKKPIDYFLPQDAEEEAGKNGNQVKDGKELNKKRNVEQEVWKREEGNKEKNEGKVDEEVERAVMAIEDGLGRVRGEVQRTLVTLACLLKDEKYVAEFCKLNNEIEILRRA